MAKQKSNRRQDRKPTKAQVLKARESLAGPDGPGNFKNVEVVVAEIIRALRDCESVVLTVGDALEGTETQEANSAGVTLRVGCHYSLSDQIARLERVVESATAPHAPRLIIHDRPVPT